MIEYRIEPVAWYKALLYSNDGLVGSYEFVRGVSCTDPLSFDERQRLARECAHVLLGVE